MSTKSKKSRKQKVRVRRVDISPEVKELILSLNDPELPIDERKELRNRLYDNDGNLHSHLYFHYYTTEYRKRKKKKS